MELRMNSRRNSGKGITTLDRIMSSATPPANNVKYVAGVNFTFGSK
jgi:hypothetical protein